MDVAAWFLTVTATGEGLTPDEYGPSDLLRRFQDGLTSASWAVGFMGRLAAGCSGVEAGGTVGLRAPTAASRGDAPLRLGLCRELLCRANERLQLRPRGAPCGEPRHADGQASGAACDERAEVPTSLEVVQHPALARVNVPIYGGHPHGQRVRHRANERGRYGVVGLGGTNAGDALRDILHSQERGDLIDRAHLGVRHPAVCPEHVEQR